MSRSGYSDDYDFDQWASIRWRGQVESAVRGKRGQAFFRALVEALDAMPTKELIAEELVCPAGVCAMGALAVHRGIDVTALDPYDYDKVGATFNVAHQLAQETAYWNDEGAWRETPAERWTRMRAWAAASVIPQEAHEDDQG